MPWLKYLFLSFIASRDPDDFGLVIQCRARRSFFYLNSIASNMLRTQSLGISPDICLEVGSAYHLGSKSKASRSGERKDWKLHA